MPDCDMPEIYEINDEEKQQLNISEFISSNKLSMSLLLVGASLIGIGVFLFNDEVFVHSTKVEVLNVTSESELASELIVEVSGAVKNPGVYKLSSKSRVEEAIIAAGGVTEKVDKAVMGRIVNRAAKVSDGQKIYIPEKVLNTDKQSGDMSATNNSGGYGSSGS